MVKLCPFQIIHCASSLQSIKIPIRVKIQVPNQIYELFISSS